MPKNNAIAPSIGQPIANTQLYILDKHLQIVPVGVPGELYVGGTNLARGYWKQPRLTAEQFIPNPLGDTSGTRLYRTGDLGRYLADGNVEFLGRVDYQVKIRGFRIELGEIENTIVQHPEVDTCVVIANERNQSKQLVAYITATNKQFSGVEHLRDFLKPKLPDYMIPASFIELDALPLTPNGKVDRRALPTPDDFKLTTTFTPPETLVEEILAEIWGAVLSMEAVSIHDNFFDLGGHSLLVTQVLSHLNAMLDISLPLRDFFNGPTIVQLAEVVENLLATEFEEEELR